MLLQEKKSPTHSQWAWQYGLRVRISAVFPLAQGGGDAVVAALAAAEIEEHKWRLIMKIAICCLENNEKSQVSERLGRSPWLGIYDTDTDKWEFLENSQNLNAAQGAGIQTGQNLVNAGAEVVLARNFGPKAMQVLQMAGVKVCEVPCGEDISECIRMYKSGELKELASANVESHWI